MGGSGAGFRGRCLRGRVRRGAGADLARRVGAVGDRARADARIQGIVRVDHLHPRLHRRGPAERSRLVGRPTDRRPRGDRRRDRGLRHLVAVGGGHRGRSARFARTHLAEQHHQCSLVGRGVPRLGRPACPGTATSAAQTRCVRTRRVLPPEGPQRVRHAAQRSACSAQFRQLDRRGPHRHPADALRRRRLPEVCSGDHSAPVRRATPKRHRACTRQTGHVDAPPERHH